MHRHSSNDGNDETPYVLQEDCHQAVEWMISSPRPAGGDYVPLEEDDPSSDIYYRRAAEWTISSPRPAKMQRCCGVGSRRCGEVD